MLCKIKKKKRIKLLGGTEDRNNKERKTTRDY